MTTGKPSYLNFHREEYWWKSDVDYRNNPHLYKVGKGEQGVLICQPYKSEIGKYWKFKTAELAKASSSKIYELFIRYLQNDDFVGADIARKYLQMGFTRSRRYANYRGGKKYDHSNDYKQLPPGTGEEIKAASARVFYEKWQEAESNARYAFLKKEWKQKYG